MTKANLFLVALLASVSLGVSAQQEIGSSDEGERQTKTFTELDGNNDGILEEDELSESDFQGSFDQLDADSDGEVNRNEYYQYYREQAN